jgi:hypothetical protein
MGKRTFFDKVEMTSRLSQQNDPGHSAHQSTSSYYLVSKRVHRKKSKGVSTFINLYQVIHILPLKEKDMSGRKEDAISPYSLQTPDGTDSESAYGQSVAEGTFQDDGTYEEGTYDEGTYGDGTYGDGTYGYNSYADNDGQSTIRTDMDDMTEYTEDVAGYASEEQSLQPTVYSNLMSSKRFTSTRSGLSLQPTVFSKHAYDKSIRSLNDGMSLADNSLQPTAYTREDCAKDRGYEEQSYAADEEGTYFTKEGQSYMGGDEVSYGQSYSGQSYSQDEMSQYTEDYSVQKPAKQLYDVETVYSDEEQSRDPTLNSSESSGQGSRFSSAKGTEYDGHPIPMTSMRSADGLSRVTENSHEDSSMSPSMAKSIRSKSSGGSNRSSLPSNQSHQTMPSVEELVATQQSSERSSRSSSTSASVMRALREKKIESSRQMNEHVARLESELEMIRVEDATNSVGVGRSLQVLRYFSRVLSAMVPMAHHPGLVDALVYQLERQPYGKHADHFHEYDDGEPRPEEDKEELAAARVDAIATLVNLACAEENKAKMASHAGLLDAITTVAQCDPLEEAREHAAIVLMNLAYEDENKELMVQHPAMLDTLVRLIQDNSPFTRRYASAAMFTLACIVGNTERMAVFCEGEILECLRRVLTDDPVDEARINASEALFNMARHNTEQTIQIMGEHPRLLATLAKSVLTDYSADVRVFCARALEWMSTSIHFPMDGHRDLLSALTVSAQWTKTSCIAEAMKTQATLTENRLPMASHDGLLQALSNLALLESMSDIDVRRNAIAALEMISRDVKARTYMVRNEQVMRALTKASFEHGDGAVYGEGENGKAVTAKLLKLALKNLSNEM